MRSGCVERASLPAATHLGCITTFDVSATFACIDSAYRNTGRCFLTDRLIRGHMSLELEGFEVDEDQLNHAVSDEVGALNEATFAQVACFSELPTQMEPDSSPPSASASTHPIEADRRHATGAVLREQDRLLPLSIIARLMAQEVPKDAKIARDAKRFMQESASEFVCFVTSEANDVALSERDRLHRPHRTISSENILTALRNIDLASFEPPMNMARSLTDFGVKDESSSKSKRPRDPAPARDGTLCTSSVDSCASTESSEGSFRSRCSREGDDSFTANCSWERDDFFTA